VRFIAANGASIFDDGTSAFEDVPGVVGGTPNSVLVTTPLVTACTTAVNASVRVFAPAGGACVDSAANYLTFNPPTITSITPAASNAYPVAPNTGFTITSATATYGPVGSPVEVRFASTNGLNIFGNGSRTETTAPSRRPRRSRARCPRPRCAASRPRRWTSGSRSRTARARRPPRC
jgi:hypothetical protein